HPAVGTTWQWQLDDPPVDQSLDVDMYDIDLFDNDGATVASLQAEGRKVICYMNAGGWENWRPDAERFASELIGVNLDDWEGERWLDISRIDILGPIMEARMDMCRAKGFDGIEPDNVDGFLNDTGFPLTYEDQLRYNIWLAERAHERGLSIGLKNDMEQIPDLLPYFDWALNEQCFEYDECETLSPFIDAGKAVFNVEYVLEPGDFCDMANDLGFSSMRKNLDLDAWRDSCN
ncbi:MAG: endo alpha-1,4 polygalactosaminidase, partial [Chloroflexi bacterium]|nr:endo alpha-1,4 polygalactosaminidase [Chloroflexota bacterium]